MYQGCFTVSFKGGVDGPAGPANAGPLSVAVRVAGALFSASRNPAPPTCVLITDLPGSLFARSRLDSCKLIRNQNKQELSPFEAQYDSVVTRGAR